MTAKCCNLATSPVGRYGTILCVGSVHGELARIRISLIGDGHNYYYPVPPENSVQPRSLQTNRKVSSGLQPSLSQVNEICTMQACATEQSSDAVKGPS
jgi:hypothetical protein